MSSLKDSLTDYRGGVENKHEITLENKRLY